MLATATPQLNTVTILRSGTETIYRQLCRQIREKILNGDLAIGTRLPSTRELARELGVSRTTIREVFEQLIAESYLSSFSGKGTFVINHPVLNASTHQRITPIPTSKQPPNKSIRATPTISKRGRQFMSIPLSGTAPEIVPFNPALPDFNLFPYSKWLRILKKTLINRNHAAMDYGDPSGYEPLKVAIAQNLHHLRGLSCDPDQVIVVASSEQAIRRIVFLLLDREECVWFGEPGLSARRNAFRTTDVKTLTVSVDNQGVVVDEANQFKDKAKLAYVVPSSHYPLGNIMSLPRRLELLNWATSNNAWILEDDFCCEFSYAGQVPPPIQTMDVDQRVIYMGGYGMTLFPSLRLAYLIVPKSLINTAKNMAQVELSVSSLLQPTLTEFISAGHLMTHVRKMRKVYHLREQFLVQFLKHHIGDMTTISGTGGGQSFILNLPLYINDSLLSEALNQKGIVAHSLSSYYLRPKSQNDHRNGLILGFACSSRVELERYATILVHLIKTYKQ